jgi:hypothetical protein
MPAFNFVFNGVIYGGTFSLLLQTRPRTYRATVDPRFTNLIKADLKFVENEEETGLFKNLNIH